MSGVTAWQPGELASVALHLGVGVSALIDGGRMSMDVDLAERVLKQITEHPETHNQGNYGMRYKSSCQTTLCIAGWAAQLSERATIEWQDDSSPWSDIEAVVLDDQRGHTNRVDPYTAGMQLLGIGVGEANLLFLGPDDRAINLLRVLIGEAKVVSE
jgi:hypothetical protein